ncbi:MULTISPECIES: hypothetical protein [unclassified Dehalobacter]|uniref:hypothetical protein n=1 Tax=unclassified Dehalobacter TaxID=2635733 RepID=UPI000E6C8676|nr:MULTISPECIES: hypothetical protein [unclassified Dehalobacter]RJE48903.1 hypothetical protein A7K50_09170 [Dehalobacter sp. MCB1]TCX52067.1 hypothetical protein C1I36_07055 [Dehalobacter sp. 14DCB1]TCX53140.1 hypothetical protein C1I38_08820 [Dehalobacter sp. 12DCB1]
MNKRLIEFGTFLGMLFLVILAVIVYIMNYSDLDSFDRINKFNIILGCLILLNMAVYCNKALKRVYKRNKVGNIICFLKPNITMEPLFLTISSGIVLVLWLHMYFNIRPSFTGLAMIILFAIMTFDSFSVYLSKTGLAEKGIVDWNNYYNWNEVLSFSYDDNKLIFRVKKKYLFFRIKGKSKFYFNKEDKNRIDQIIEELSGLS